MKPRIVFFVLMFMCLASFSYAQLLNENFEGDWESAWYSDYGVWQVGTPTVGPGSAYQGSNCLAVALQGEYPSNALSKFININPFIVPTASLNPRLRFESWFDFNQHSNDRDHGRVLIKNINETEWTQLGDIVSVTSGGTWFNDYYSLSAFAGQAVQIAFELDVWDTTSWPYDDPNEGPGWFIDNIQIETGATVFNNPETWENGIGDWYVTHGTWEVGTPTNGPGAAFEGVNCLATRLDSDYWGRVYSRIVSPICTIPALSQNPRLRFDTWYILNEHNSDSDHGRVLIKPDGVNEWIQLDSNITVNSGGIWFNAYYDLSAYAGQAVQIAFELDVWDTTSWPYDDPNEGPGWFIDNIQIETGATVFNNPETWENGIGDWYVTHGTWEVGTPTNGPGAAFEGVSCLATRLDSDYWGRVYSRIVSPVFTVPALSQNPRLRFQTWHILNEHNSDSDHGRVLIKSVNDTEWQQLGSNITINSGGVWFITNYDLLAYANQTVQIAFELDVWDTTSWPYDDPNEGPGWFIDNIQIETGATVFNNPETWENGIGDWSVTCGTWEVGVPTSGPNTAYQSTKCLATRLDSNYWGRAYSRVVSPEITIPPAAQNPRLRFQSWFSFNQHNNSSDHGRVLIKVVGDTVWEEIDSSINSNSGDIWFNAYYELQAYAEQTVQIAFEIDVWDTTSWPYDDPNEGPGWFIDNIQIETGAAVFNNPETWENGIGNWYVTKGTWEVGEPSSGPNEAYEGANCLATRLSGEYFNWAYTKAISPQYTVPAAAQYPRFTFMEWHSFNQSDHGTVLIKAVSDTVWTALSEDFSSNSSSVWSYVALDLRAYAGQIVQFAFELDSWYNDVGWYIDNIQIKTGTPVFNNPETWENGIGDWYVSNGTWEVGTPTSGPNAAYQGAKCLATKLDGDYYSYNKSRAVSPVISISPTIVPILRFRNWYNIGGGDTCFVQIKPVNGSNWQNLTGGIYTGNTGGVWNYTYFQLTQYLGQQVQLGFYLDSDGGSSAGWYIDNITITGSNTNPTVVNPISDLTMAEDTQSSLNILNTFYDPDVASSGQVLYYSCYGNAHIAVAINQITGLVSLTPQANWFGTETITFSASDQNGGIAYDEVLVTVTPVNDPVTIDFPVSFTINQNEFTPIDFASYISNPDGDVLGISITGNANIAYEMDGVSVTFHPDTNWIGSELLTVTVNDNTTTRSNNLRSRDIVTDQFTVHVINPLVVDFSTNSIMNNNVVANDPQTSLLFTTTSSIPITSYQWDFDNDGVVDSESSEPDYIYSTPGVKTVKLTASDDVHVTVVTKTDYVNVLPGTLVPPQVFDTDVVWTEAGGPYNISGELVFNNGISLTVEPNAQVNLMVDSLLIINGTINALDADFNAYGPNGWGGLVLNSSSNNSVINGINLYGAATGLTINGCNPVITNLELNGNSATRTVTTGITIHDNAAPTISNITINNFNQGLIAQNSTAIPEVLNISGISINRLSNNYAPNDIGISIEGDYDATLQDIMVVDYPNGIEIINPTGTSRPARLTNSRVVKTESSSRNPGTAIRIVNASYISVVNDSLIGYTKGIVIENTHDLPTDLWIAANRIDYNNPGNSPDIAIQVSGTATGFIDSLWVAKYATGLMLTGNQSLQIEQNTFVNCDNALQDYQNHLNHVLKRNTIFRNTQYTGYANTPALILSQATNLTAINNTIYSYPIYINASGFSSLSFEQNIAWCLPPIASPIILTGGSTINATYNDIALPAGIYPGVGNINADPMFIDAATGDFALNPGSPCINSGNPANPHDPDTSVADMGAVMWDVTTVPLVADFIYNNTSGQNPLTVQFTDQSTFIVIGWSWDFNYDDIIDSNEENPIWTYTTPGSYTVKLTVWDGIRFESKVCLNLITVLNSGPIITQPLPDITRAEDFATFQIDLSSYFSDANGDPLTYSYNVDSNIVTALVDQNILTISSALNQYGTVNFTVTAEDGFPSPGKQSNTYTRTAKSGDNRISPRVSVSDSFTLTISAINDPPVIEAYSPNADSLEVEYNVPIAFSVTATDVDSPLQYYWYLNDVLQTDNDNTMTCQFSPAPSNRLKVKVSDGILDVFHTWIVTSSSANDDNLQVVSTALNRIYPNPFNHETKIEYQLKSPARVKIEVFNVKGQLVRTLINQDETSGVHNVKWSVNHNNKYDLPNGIYFLRVQLHDQSIVRRVVLIK